MRSNRPTSILQLADPPPKPGKTDGSLEPQGPGQELTRFRIVSKAPVDLIVCSSGLDERGSRGGHRLRAPKLCPLDVTVGPHGLGGLYPSVFTAS